MGEMRRPRLDSPSRGDWTGISKGSAGSEGCAPAGGCTEGLRHGELRRGDSAGTLGVGGHSWRGRSWEPHRSAPGGAPPPPSLRSSTAFADHHPAPPPQTP